MKSILAATAVFAMSLTGTMAAAQDRHNDNRGQHMGQNDRGGHDARRGPDKRGHGRYARGQRYQGDGAYLSDYKRYGYRAPPRGYRYYRANNGDVVLAAAATGIISAIIASGTR